MFKSLRLSLLAIGIAGLAAALAVLAQAVWSFNALDRSAREALTAKDVVADILPPPMYLIELRLTLSRTMEQLLPQSEASGEVDRLEKEYKARVDYWTANPPLGLQRLLLGKQHESAQQLFAAARVDVLDKLKQGDADGARRGLARVDELYRAHRKHVDETVAAGNEVAERSISTFGRGRTQGLWSMFIVTFVLLVAMYLCYVNARRSILRPVEDCVAVATAVAEGDLTKATVTQRADELGQLQQALSRMTSQLAALVGDVRDGANSIAAAASQISQGNDDLSTRTQEQASALEETAASMEEMTATVKRNADNANAAKQLASAARNDADKGGAVVRETIKAMEEISDSSRKIADIIGVIDEIAFQTNLLALNAAVEAARAGEQGRGFAVVATEVRNLAQRSAVAAKEIKELINASVGKVQTGAELVNASGQTLQAITESIRKVSDVIGEISSASGEQASGIDQINNAVVQMDQSTQQNAALVEEAASASKLMSDQSRDLVSKVAFFRTDASQGRPSNVHDIRATPPKARNAEAPAFAKNAA